MYAIRSYYDRGVPAFLLERLRYLSETVRGRGCHGQYRCGLAIRFVDLLLLFGFGLLDDALLLAFRLVDLGVALAFGGQDDRALFA